MIDIEKLQSKSGIIGNSDSIREVLDLIAQVAPVDITVLVSGESGTGKEMIAKAIHKFSKRAQDDMITVNCGAIPAGIIESELFGHKKGSFTGANEDRKGYFESAHKGTIFLDEIGETDPSMQVRLLRVLQDGEIRPLGSSETVQEARVYGTGASPSTAGTPLGPQQPTPAPFRASTPLHCNRGPPR